MLGQIGFPTLILILVLALLLFGPNKLPELGRAFGKTLREFKQGAKDIMDDDFDSNQQQVNHSTTNATAMDRPGEDQRENPKRLPE